MKPEHEQIIARIEAVRLCLGLNRSRFCTAFGLVPQSYNNFIGAQHSKPNIDLVAGVCRAHGASADFVLFGEGQMFRHQAPPAPVVVADIRPVLAEVVAKLQELIA